MAEDKKVEKKGFSNPALRMMGIPRISLPSRNWMIFIGVVSAIGGGLAYDKHQQKQIRKKYMEQVEQYGKEVYDSNRLPRKLTVFIAPPPDDFLDTSMKYFRKYIKPILNSAAIDFDILVANKQGDIRTSVSDRIRQLRRDQIEQQEPQPKSWKDAVVSAIKATFVTKEEPPESKSYRELYSTTDVLGYYYKYDTINPVRDDAVADEAHAGGVICIGRGAYKEYLQGVHEGLLGPLDREEPAVASPEVKTIEQDTREAPEVKSVEQDTREAPEVKTIEAVQEQVDAAPEQADAPEEAEESKDEESAAPPFIRPEDYANAQLAPEFDFSNLPRDNKQVPLLFKQPIYVFMVPNILGFLNTPKKIYGWFTRRYVAEDFSEQTLKIVNNDTRPFEYKDQFLAKQEELLWPKRWVQKGKEKGSEWVQELVVDERVTEQLRVID